jgi:hypothetical protein
MSLLYTDLDALSERLAISIQDDFAKAIKAKILENIDPMIEDIAKQYAESIVARAGVFRDYAGDSPIKVVLNIDRKKVDM